MPRQLPILVTTDLQQDAASIRRSRAVHRQALELAKRLGAPVELVHVAQVDALTLDEADSIRRASSFHSAVAASSAASVGANALGGRSAPSRSGSGRPITVVAIPTFERKYRAIFSPISARFSWKS